MTGSERTNAISVVGLSKRYRSNVACDELHLTVRAGTTFGLLGPNGAGKSTLIRMLMGLIPSDSGEARVLGESISGLSLARRMKIGYVPELHFMYRWMTVAQVINFVSRLYCHWDASLAECLLERYELPKGKRVSSLSKGMTAKLGLLLALSHRPELLILDEPTSGLDPVIREDFLESVLQSHIGNGRTVLFSSHHVDDVERVSDDVGIMIQGKLLVHGSVDELRSRFKRIVAVLQHGRLPHAPPPGTVFQKVARREWSITVNGLSQHTLEHFRSENDIEHVDVIDLNLEEIFKDLVRGYHTHGAEVHS